MHFLIDWGNTNVKLALFENEAMVEIKVFSGTLEREDFETFLGQYPINAAMVSTVAGLPGWVEKALQALPYYKVFDHLTPLPFENQYATPETLGLDRLAGVAGAQATFSGKPALVIDAGTCITYDAIAAGVYQGGIIAPGLNMRLKAMHHFTHGLPLVEPGEDPPLEGDSTQSAMQSGAVNGLTAEVVELVHRYREQYPGLQVVATGGDYPVLVKALKNAIFADPYLVLKGLNIILSHNRKLKV